MKKQILILLMALVSATTFAQTSKSAKHVNAENGLAIQGYDPVAYFESSKATKGSKEISTTYQETTYYFSNENNKALFLKNPTQYIPQFGGYCAYGMSEGYEAPIKPEAFTIVDNKLYLNYNLKVKETWLKDKEKRIQKANENWNK
ncbi:YHS domain protein [Flavobacterium plurextorum]|uniref:YHS domain-containing (seleno)protein n=1 Tax=Flavobacterium TaxID=237 RepID=UPI00214DD39F|nr:MULTISPECIES: YHS domain-containing (seleno)protein [Flavobacterium]UUW08425.1 YHS domain protein [Flavobacterium plurextorum]